MDKYYAVTRALNKYMEQYSSDNNLQTNFTVDDIVHYFIIGVVSNPSLEAALLKAPSFEVLSIIFDRADIDNSAKKMLSDNYIKLRLS